jgi:phage major head subunit gpT-like protein
LKPARHGPAEIAVEIPRSKKSNTFGINSKSPKYIVENLKPARHGPAEIAVEIPRSKKSNTFGINSKSGQIYLQKNILDFEKLRSILCE